MGRGLWFGRLGPLLFVACQRTITLTPPPGPNEGSLWVVGAAANGPQNDDFVFAGTPDAPVTVGPVAFQSGAELFAFHQPCSLEEIAGEAGMPLPSGELSLGASPNPGRPLPAPVHSFRSGVGDDGTQSPWLEEDILPDSARSLLGRAPLPIDLGCRMGVSKLETEVVFIPGIGDQVAILQPKVFAAVGTDRALLALNYSTDFSDTTRIGYGVFEYPLAATDSEALIPLRESATSSNAYLGGAVVGQEGWIQRAGAIDRVDLSTSPWRLMPGILDSFTASIAEGRIEYQALSAASEAGEAPEILMLTTRIEIGSAGSVSEQRPTILRHFDPVTRRLTTLDERQVRIRGMVGLGGTKPISLARIGPGRALIVGLDGGNETLHYLNQGQLTELRPPAEVLAEGELAGVRKAPAVGYLVDTNRGALFRFDLAQALKAGGTERAWTLLRAHYTQGSEADLRGDIVDIFGFNATPEGFLLIGPGVGGQAVTLYREGLGFCRAEAYSDQVRRASVQLPDRTVGIEYNISPNSLRVRTTRFGRPPLACAQPATPR